ncbi:meckelin-like [Ciona intestinalis]
MIQQRTIQTLAILIVHFSWFLTVHGQLSYLQVSPTTCGAVDNQFFNSANLRCGTCFPSTGIPDANFLSCSCPLQSKTEISSDGSSPFICTSCPTNTLPTNDGRDCISCSGASVQVNVLTQRCTCNNSTASLVERFSNGTVMLNAECIECTQSFTGPSADNNVCSACVGCGQCTFVGDGVCVNLAVTENVNSDSAYIQQKAQAAFLGCQAKNITACQALSNMCVMETYAYYTSNSACRLYSLFYNQPLSTTYTPLSTLNSAWLQNLPWIYINSLGDVNNLVDVEILTSTEIPTAFSFKGANTILDLVVFKYDVNGTFLGEENANTGILQLCPDQVSRKSAAFVFGTSYASSCTLTPTSLQSVSNYPPMFYELNLRYTINNEVRLFPVPVTVTNFRDADGQSAQVLVRRFFLVDNLSRSTLTTTTSTQSTPAIRYASSVSISVTLQPVGNGLIHPPHLTITYSDLNIGDNGVPVATTAPTTFSVNYLINVVSTTSQIEAFQISLAVLGSLSVLYSFFETGSWRRRQGLQVIDGTSLFMFIFYTLSNLANVFFIVMFGFSTVTLIFYKGQSTVTHLLPDPFINFLFLLFFAMAFAFKTIQILVMIFMQSSMDIFLVDWERPRVNDAEGKVSIWRTFFIANEWNEIQTCRKLSVPLQLFLVVLFLEVIGFKSLALENPTTAINTVVTSSSDLYIPPYNSILRFAVASLVYLVIAFIQVLYNIAIHERFIHDQIREFIDLCSVSNVSVFILAHNHYGYYIHGRSVHGRADTDMMQMNAMLKKEEENLTSSRGLDPGTEQQTYEIAIPLKFRNQFDKIYQPLELMRNQPAARGGTSPMDSKSSENVRAYSTMRNFLTAFLDHSLRDLDYFIKDKMFLENLMDTEFREPIEAAYFYNDPGNSFTNVLFYGNEFALLLFEVLLFNIIDYSQQNFPLAAILTYMCGQVLVFIREFLGQQNLATKTLVDKRFLV